MEQTRGVEDPSAGASPTTARSAESAPAETQAAAVVPWLLATPDDLGNRDFEAPIVGSISAEGTVKANQYRRFSASNLAERVDDS